MPKLIPGSGKDPSSDSMAKAMVDAFMAEWPNFMGDQDLPGDAQLESLRHIFVAVSKGLIDHLKENSEAFQVSITDEENGSGEVSEIL